MFKYETEVRILYFFKGNETATSVSNILNNTGTFQQQISIIFYTTKTLKNIFSKNFSSFQPSKLQLWNKLRKKFW